MKFLNFKWNRTNAHMNSQRLWQHEQNLQIFKPEEIQAHTERNGHWVAPLTKNIFAIDTHLQRENQFSPTEFHSACPPHVVAGSIPRSRWSTQNELSGVFVDFCSILLCLLRCILSYWSFACLFWFLLLWIFLSLVFCFGFWFLFCFVSCCGDGIF